AVACTATPADELSSGYYDHHLLYLHALRDDPAALAAARAAWEAEVQPIVRHPFLRNANAFIDAPSLRGHIYLNADVFSGYCLSGGSEPFAETAFTQDLMRNRM